METAREMTRDRLYNSTLCPTSITPSGSLCLSSLSDMIFKIASDNGYVGDRGQFEEDLASSLNGGSATAGVILQRGSVNDFPEVGQENALYIDNEQSIIYYWKNGNYYQILASLIPLTILDGGKA